MTDNELPADLPSPLPWTPFSLGVAKSLEALAGTNLRITRRAEVSGMFTHLDSVVLDVTDVIVAQNGEAVVFMDGPRGGGKFDRRVTIGANTLFTENEGEFTHFDPRTGVYTIITPAPKPRR